MSNGTTLAGLLELPERSAEITGFGLFAHCFTCAKDIAAASRISRALAARGIAVLRFDFTRLGNSDGDFSNTSFCSDIEDLLRSIVDVVGRLHFDDFAHVREAKKTSA